MAVPTTTQAKLDDARAKYHQLLTGSLRVVIRDGDKTIEYTQADRASLKTYIADLEYQLAEATSTGSGVRRRPAGFIGGA